MSCAPPSPCYRLSLRLAHDLHTFCISSVVIQLWHHLAVSSLCFKLAMIGLRNVSLLWRLDETAQLSVYFVFSESFFALLHLFHLETLSVLPVQRGLVLSLAAAEGWLAELLS